ncbi:MAG: response regulator transcription factor [Elusimicrobia bacterium]|nr:response regulator transcription factor [Elusimicrobiota bacterium]
MSPSRVSVVEDDPEMGKYFQLLLKNAGFAAALFPTAGRFLDHADEARPDALILDMSLPGLGATELVRILRADPRFKRLCIVAVSGEHRTTSDIVHGLEAGVDEYLVKPIEPELFLARLETLLRRAGSAADADRPVRVGELEVSLAARSVRRAGQEVRLTRLEFELLLHFLRNPGRVLTRGILLESVWGGQPGMDTRTVDKHVETLRKKLGLSKDALASVIGVGYVLKEPQRV